MFDALKNTLAPLLLRLALAVIFIVHGYQKVWSDGNELGAAWLKAGNEKNIDPPGKVIQLGVAWGELIGGAAVGLGILTRLAAAGLIVIKVGAIVAAGWQNFSIGNAGSEYNMLMIASCAVLVLEGGGKLAADRFIRLRRRQ